MKRISTATAQANKFGAGKNGFRDGDKGAGIAPTDLDAGWFDRTQEEISNVIEGAGIVLDPAGADNTQMLQAIKLLIAGGDYHPSCRVASTAALNTAAPGANIDGIAMVASDRVLLKDQAAPAQNGIWVWNGAAVAMTRALDADAGAEINSGALVPVEVGTANADTLWMLTTDGVVTVGVSALTFANITGLTIAIADARYTNIGYMLVRDEKAQNTPGGATATGTTTARTLNTVSANTISGASLAANQITLPAGTYRIDASAPTHSVDESRISLYNVTDGAVQILGTCENGITAVVTRSFLKGRFTIAAPKVFELRHYVGTTIATNGFGLQVNSGGVEVYTQIEITKES
ncbi:MAG TPA: hypothetical protein VK974_04665 [Methylophilaceae bacterium]|nr:hypothetical protein [Methylophilaceae bacterium]